MEKETRPGGSLLWDKVRILIMIYLTWMVSSVKLGINKCCKLQYFFTSFFSFHPLVSFSLPCSNLFTTLLVFHPPVLSFSSFHLSLIFSLPFHLSTSFCYFFHWMWPHCQITSCRKLTEWKTFAKESFTILLHSLP